MATELQPHRFTVDAYRLLIDCGALSEGGRLELLDGLIVDMAPIGLAHAQRQMRVGAYFVQTLGASANVVGPCSFPFAERDMPEPDLAILDGGWANRSGSPDLTECRAVIEIAQTSLRLDLGPKARLYARAGIPDYLVVDIDGARLVHHARPVDGGYATVTNLDASATFTLARFPQTVLSAAALL